MCDICAAAQSFDPRRHGNENLYDAGYAGMMRGEAAAWSVSEPAAANVAGVSWGETPSTVGDWGGVVSWSLGPAGQSLDAFGGAIGGSVNPTYGFDHVALIQAAFDEWSAYGNIEFVQVEDPGTSGPGGTTDPDIRIFFGEIEGGTIGYAYYPTNWGSALAGDILLESQLPQYMTANGFFMLALHEIGHALGLGHVNISAVMNGTVDQNLTGLQPDDIAGIQEIYGTQDNAASTYTMDGSRADLNLLDTPEGLTVEGNALNNEIDGTESAERMLSGDGADTLIGRGGDDTFVSGAGRDEIRGGDGNDDIRGGGGADTLRGGDDFDFILGNSGRDELFGQGSADTIRGGRGDDSINGGGGSDMLYGGGGDDFVKGGGQRDLVEGGAGNDTLVGNGRADTLVGGNGADRLLGGNHNDRLNGGRGDDFLNGGSGRDVFVFDLGHDNDRIAGFDTGEDVLEIDGSLTDGVSDAQQVIDQFADVQSNGVLIDFGGGDTILLAGLTSLSGLSDAIDIV